MKIKRRFKCIKYDTTKISTFENLQERNGDLKMMNEVKIMLIARLQDFLLRVMMEMDYYASVEEMAEPEKEKTSVQAWEKVKPWISEIYDNPWLSQVKNQIFTRFEFFLGMIPSRNENAGVRVVVSNAIVSTIQGWISIVQSLDEEFLESLKSK